MSAKNLFLHSGAGFNIHPGTEKIEKYIEGRSGN